jgi:hypothetical protein
MKLVIRSFARSQALRLGMQFAKLQLRKFGKLELPRPGSQPEGWEPAATLPGGRQLHHLQPDTVLMHSLSRL